MKKKKGNQNTDKEKKENPEQSRRFVETAKELESDESGQTFDKAIRKISKK